jgi:hypothetical protein
MDPIFIAYTVMRLGGRIFKILKVLIKKEKNSIENPITKYKADLFLFL